MCLGKGKKVLGFEEDPRDVSIVFIYVLVDISFVLLLLYILVCHDISKVIYGFSRKLRKDAPCSKGQFIKLSHVFR